VECPRFEDFHRAAIGSDRGGDAAADNEEIIDTSLLGKSSDTPLESPAACHPSGCEMGYWFAADICQAPRRHEHFSIGVAPPEVGEIHARARRQQSGKLLARRNLPRENFD
jgi:hypothetical protein